MTRFIFVLGGFLLTVFLISVSLVDAQQQEKVPRIGFLGSLSGSSDERRVEAFLQGLRELGYVEGKNILLSTDMPMGSPKDSPGLRQS